MKMTQVALLMLAAGVATQSAKAVVIDDYSGDLSNYTATVLLDVNGGASNTFAYEISGGALQLTTSAYDDIEQSAFIFNGLSLLVGEELQVDFAANGGSQDLGLYVGGSTPVAGVRANYLSVFARMTNGQGASIAPNVLSGGFTDISLGTTGFPVDPGVDKLFIARDGVNDYELGYYFGGVRTIVADRDGIAGNNGSVVGFYADVRAAGTAGTLDNLVIVPEPGTVTLLGLCAIAGLHRTRIS